MAQSRFGVTRREFIVGTAALAESLVMQASSNPLASRGAGEGLGIYQERRRRELWKLLGDLPWLHKPAPPRRLATEKHDGLSLIHISIVPEVGAGEKQPHRGAHEGNHEAPLFLVKPRRNEQPDLIPVSYTHLDVYKRQA